MTITLNRQLLEDEDIIARGLSNFIEVGQALTRIRDRQDYLGEYSTFEDYCTRRWNMPRQHAYRLIDAAQVVEDVSPVGDTLPSNEWQIRPLAPLSPDERRQAWEEAVRNAEDGQPTNRQVAATVRRLGLGPARSEAGADNPLVEAHIRAYLDREFLQPADRLLELRYLLRHIERPTPDGQARFAKLVDGLHLSSMPQLARVLRCVHDALAVELAPPAPTLADQLVALLAEHGPSRFVAALAEAWQRQGLKPERLRQAV